MPKDTVAATSAKARKGLNYQEGEEKELITVKIFLT